MDAPSESSDKFDWMEKAACKENTELFFFTGTYSVAKMICSTCPVFYECKNYADNIENNLSGKMSIHGIYSGETPKERLSRRRKEKKCKRTNQILRESRNSMQYSDTQ